MFLHDVLDTWFVWACYLLHRAVSKLGAAQRAALGPVCTQQTKCAITRVRSVMERGPRQAEAALEK